MIRLQDADPKSFLNIANMAGGPLQVATMAFATYHRYYHYNFIKNIYILYYLGR